MYPVCGGGVSEQIFFIHFNMRHPVVSVALMHTMYFDEHTSAICVISEEVNHNIINLAFVH